jgi:hypothetical protein
MTITELVCGAMAPVVVGSYPLYYNLLCDWGYSRFYSSLVGGGNLFISYCRCMEWANLYWNLG